jgi:RNA polymerase sigma factor (TIGR02999 family)
MNDVTRILSAIEQGDPSAAGQLLPLVYDQLRRLAAVRLANEKAGQTLQPTALVHEAYLRMVGGDTPQCFNGRGHFFAAAAELMRRILVENARRKGRIKRGGGKHREFRDLDAIDQNTQDDELLSLHETLEKFAVQEPTKAKLVELRFFGGLTLEQAAESLNTSLSTADRGWHYARAWLYANMADASSESAD